MNWLTSVAVVHFTCQVAAASFLSGVEQVPAGCRLYDPRKELAVQHLSFQSNSLEQSEADESGRLIRLGCPKNYKLFAEFHCIHVDHLRLYRTGSMKWSQLLVNRVNKSSLEHLNRDQGRCRDYGPVHAPTVEFDDDHCIVLSAVCQYKFGSLDFDWVLPHREQFPPQPKNRPLVTGNEPIASDAILPPGHDCGVIDSYVEFDETHCVLRSALDGFIVGLHTWDELLEQKVNKVYLATVATSTTTSTSRPSAPRTEAELSVLKLLAPLIGPYISNVVNNGRNQEIWFRDPPGMSGRGNWKRLASTPFDHRGSHRLGLLRDHETESTTSAPSCRTRSGKRGRCKLLKDCFQPKFYTSLETFLDHSCSATRGVVGICCPLKASLKMSGLSFRTLTPAKTKEWEQLVASIDAQRIRLAPLTTSATAAARTLNADEARALVWLQPIVHQWIAPTPHGRAPELLVVIPDDVKHEMKKLRNWRTRHWTLKQQQLGFGFGSAELQVEFLPCETSRKERGHCKVISRCLQADFYESREHFFNNSCPSGSSIGVCCPVDLPTTTTRSSSNGRLTFTATATNAVTSNWRGFLLATTEA